MPKKSSQRSVSSTQRKPRSSQTPSLHRAETTADSDSLERAWIDAEAIWTSAEPLSGAVTAARVATAPSNVPGRAVAKAGIAAAPSPSSSSSSSSPTMREGRNSSGSGDGGGDRRRRHSLELRTPASQLLSQQPRLSRGAEENLSDAVVATALFGAEATIAAKPTRRGTGQMAAIELDSFLSDQTGGALSSSPSRSSRGRVSSSSTTAAAAAAATAHWSPHDATVRAMLDADPPTATRVVQLQRGYTMPSPQTPLWSQLDNDEEEEEESALERDETPTTARRHQRHGQQPQHQQQRLQRIPDRLAGSTYALADPSIALVSGDSEVYQTLQRHPHAAATLGHAEDASEVQPDAFIGLSLTQEALAIDEEMNHPHDRPLLRRGHGKRGTTTTTTGRTASVDDSIEWTVARPAHEDAASRGASEARPSTTTTAAATATAMKMPPRYAGKRSRSSVALVTADPDGARGWSRAPAGAGVWAGLSFAPTPSASTARGGSTSLLTSSQRRLQSWAAQQRQFFDFIDDRSLLTVPQASTPEKPAAGTDRSRALRTSPRAAAAAATTTSRRSSGRGSPHKRLSVPLVDRSSPQVPRVWRRSETSAGVKKQPLLLAARLQGSGASGASQSPAPGHSKFAQFVSNVKKRGTATAAAPSSSVRTQSAHNGVAP